MLRLSSVGCWRPRLRVLITLLLLRLLPAVFFAALDDWESVGLANLCKTTLYNDLRRLVDRCRVVFDCLDMEYEVDEVVLDYVIYRYAQRLTPYIGHCLCHSETS